MIKFDPMVIFENAESQMLNFTITNQAPSMWDVEEAWEAKCVPLCNADNNPARNDIPVPEGFDEAYAEAKERRAQWLEQEGSVACGDDEWGNR